MTNLLQAGVLLVLPAFEVQGVSAWRSLGWTDLEKMGEERYSCFL